MYDARETDGRFGEIVEQLRAPLDPDKTSEQDAARYAYYNMLYSDDMYDEFGNYDFGLAEQRRAQFIKQFGSDAFQYIQDYGATSWNEPPEMAVLRRAREITRKYWQVENQMWSQVPSELKQISDQVMILERTDERAARRILVQYPQIVWIRKLIARNRKMMKQQDSQLRYALETFYAY